MSLDLEISATRRLARQLSPYRMDGHVDVASRLKIVRNITNRHYVILNLLLCDGKLSEWRVSQGCGRKSDITHSSSSKFSKLK